MTIRTRLALGLFAIAVVLLLPLGLSLRSLDRVHDQTMALRDREFAASLLLGRMRAATEDLRAAETSLLFFPDVAGRDAMAMQISRLAAMLDTLRTYQLREAADQIRSAITAVVRYAPLEYQAALADTNSGGGHASSRQVVPAINSVERRFASAAVAAGAHERARSGDCDTHEEAQRLAAGSLALAMHWRCSSPSRSGDRSAALQISRRNGRRRRRHLEPDCQCPRSGATNSVDCQAAFRWPPSSRSSIASRRSSFPLRRTRSRRVNVILDTCSCARGVYARSLAAARISRPRHQTRSLPDSSHQLLDVSRFEAGGGKIYPRRWSAPLPPRSRGDVRVLSSSGGYISTWSRATTFRERYTGMPIV